MADADEKKSLFVSNFDRKVSDSLLYELFLQAGPIDSVSISNAIDNTSVGVITYKHISSVSYAKDIFRGTCLFDRKLTITSENLFDYALMRANEARDSSLRGVRTYDNDTRYMEPRNRNEMHRSDRRDRYDPYDRYGWRNDREYENRRDRKNYNQDDRHRRHRY